ncbi:hypothetical protein SDC9_127153 [bioreactor metagenome]|uniref:Uncharacterized protein n=1 Tax=bioreactor metagenome TaxID=1076179 RepID=A0A645CT56_9ZZZZ
MIESVAFALPDKLIGIIFDKQNRIFRLHIFRMRLFEEGLIPITRIGIVPIHFQVILFAVEFGNIYEFLIGAPGHVCQVLLFGFSGFQVNGLSGFYIINPDSYFVAFLACHWILDAFLRCNPGGDVHNRIIGNHCFIHPVKRQLVSVW